MIVVADTNIVLRLIIASDSFEQKQAAFCLLKEAEKFVIPVMVFCEYCWVLRREMPGKAIADSIRMILRYENVVVDVYAVRAGLRMLDAGGDFADGVIQHLGDRMAGAPSVFASFDRKALRLLAAQGFATLVPTLPTPPQSDKTA